jgi:hypothetical protein
MCVLRVACCVVSVEWRMRHGQPSIIRRPPSFVARQSKIQNPKSKIQNPSSDRLRTFSISSILPEQRFDLRTSYRSNKKGRPYVSPAVRLMRLCHQLFSRAFDNNKE